MKDTVLLKSIETVLERAFPAHNVLELSVKAGSNDGDNYLGIMHAVAVELEGKAGGQRETKHLLLKTSFENEARKEFGDELQIFNKEVAFYQEVIPALLKLQEGKISEEKRIVPAFVKCYGASSPYLTLSRKCDGTEDCLHCAPPLPWDYVLMEDVREHGGYRMADRFLGLDLDHTELVVKELARFHALGHAYIKSLSSDTELFQRFPSLKEGMFSKENEPKMRGVCQAGTEGCLKILATVFPPASAAYEKLKALSEGVFQVNAHFVAGSTDLPFSEILSTPVELQDVNLTGRDRKARNQWLVITHGDAWLNNFLFSYSGERPSGVKLVDLQIVRENCVTSDLAYLLYMSCTGDLRKAHLDRVLETYYESFKGACRRLEVEPWADFTLENLRAKYRKAVLYGAASALAFLPITLLPKESALDMEKEFTEDRILGDVYVRTLDNNRVLEDRILAIAQECLDSRLLDE